MSIEVSQFLFRVGHTDRWLVTVVTWSRDMKDLFSSKTRVCVCGVLCRFLVWWKSVYECGVCGSSVQSQQWLGVLAFPVVFVFQCAGLHHGLGPESKNTHMLTEAAAEALTFLEAFCLIS